MDESTSALDEPREKIMYDLIRKRLPNAGIISVGHRSTLFALHDKELNLNGGSQAPDNSGIEQIIWRNNDTDEVNRWAKNS